MNKNQFYNEIRENLKNFSSAEVDNIIEYYDEIIVEKTEVGMSEEEAIDSFGEIKNIVNSITADLVLVRSESKKPNSVRNFFIILGICASPILLPIGIAFFAVFLSFLIVILSLIFSFSVSAIAILISIIPMAIEMNLSGAGYPVILIAIGLALLVSGIMILLTIGTIQIGRSILNMINKKFSNSIKNKSKGEKK